MKLNSFVNLLTTAYLLIESIITVSAIDCYQCESNLDIDCSQEFDEKYTKLRPQPCDHVHEARYCIKSTGMFEGQIGTKRMCSSRDYGDYCDYVRRPGDERDYRSCIYTCSGDACNHSTSLFVSNLYLFSSLILFSCLSIIIV